GHPRGEPADRTSHPRITREPPAQRIALSVAHFSPPVKAKANEGLGGPEEGDSPQRHRDGESRILRARSARRPSPLRRCGAAVPLTFTFSTPLCLLFIYSPSRARR